MMMVNEGSGELPVVIGSAAITSFQWSNGELVRGSNPSSHMVWQQPRDTGSAGEPIWNRHKETCLIWPLSQLANQHRLGHQAR